MDICVIGLGYVGLVTGAVFADLGNEVICVDVMKEKVEGLRRGEMPIYEPGLSEMVVANRDDGRLTFTTDIREGVRKSEIIFICVGTPPKDNGETDLSQVEAAARQIGGCIESYKVIVNKSTVPVGTGDLVSRIINEHKRGDVEFDVVSCPEFLREGSAIQDSLSPDRIVIGAPNKQVAMKLIELYSTLERPMLITDVRSAEIIKYASNAFLCTKISFINAIADLCELTGADVADVAKGIGADRRIGSDFLSAGLGFGGSCFPKDLESLIKSGEAIGYDFRMLKEVAAINQQRVPQLLKAIRERLSPLEGKTVGVLGLSFKANTDDMREARAVGLIRGLLSEGAHVKAYDPVAMDNARVLMPEVEYCRGPYEVAEGADALVIVTEWREFLQLNMERLRSFLKRPIIFDGRNIYSPEKMRRMNFEYHSVGRP